MEESPKRGLLAAYRRLLQPLIRILIRNGVTFDEFSDVAKRAYIDTAARNLVTETPRSGWKRVTALTGLDADEIVDALERGKNESIDSILNLIAVTLTGWHTDSEFTGPYGVPLELQLDANGETDFRRLVDKFSGKASSAEKILKELVRVGTVVETEKGWFRATSRFHILEGSAPSGIEHLSRSVEEFVTTLDHNTQEQSPDKRLFERQTYTTDGIKPKDLPRFKEFACSRAKNLLEELDNWVSQLEIPDKANDTHIVTGLGIYQYISTENTNKDKH